MILRSIPRPQRLSQTPTQRQLHAALFFLNALHPCKQTRAASTNGLLPPRSSPRTSHSRNASRHLSVSARRGLAQHQTGFEGHTLPVLAHGETFAEQGVDGFLSPEGFDLAWTQYQSMMLEKLNALTYGTVDSATKPQGLVEKYARSPDKASLFNHASMAANNHFFFKCLSPTPTQPSTTFGSDISDSFSSHDTLRTELIETADAMFGPGFVWIVKDQERGKMKLLCTYLAGSPYPAAHIRAQQLDMATYPTAVRNRHSEPTNTSGSFGIHSRSYRDNPRAPGNYNAYPVLCVNTWEHGYLRDYGIGGKRAYLERWWDRIDWAVVEDMARAYGPETFRRSHSSFGLGRTLATSFAKSPSYNSR